MCEVALISYNPWMHPLSVCLSLSLAVCLAGWLTGWLARRSAGPTARGFQFDTPEEMTKQGLILEYTCPGCSLLFIIPSQGNCLPLGTRHCPQSQSEFPTPPCVYIERKSFIIPYYTVTTHLLYCAVCHTQQLAPQWEPNGMAAAAAQ